MKRNCLAYLARATWHALAALLLAVVAPLAAAASLADFSHPVDLSPTALAVTANGQTVYIACATAARILVFDVASQSVLQAIPTPGSPSGLALSRDESRLYITCAGPASLVCVMNTTTGQILSSTPAGHTALAPVLSPDGATLYICSRFDHQVTAIDAAAGCNVWQTRVAREPVAAAVTPDGQRLFVANHLHAGRSDQGVIGAVVSVIETDSGRLLKNIQLPRGSGLVRGIALSPDGKFAAVTHLMARYYLPTTDIEFGKINANALSFLDLERLQWIRVVYLDYSGQGAANPWAVAWMPDGQSLVVTHAGTHELSWVDAPVAPQKPVRVRQRIALPGNGPRALAAAGSLVFVANYFSDNLCLIDLAEKCPEAIGYDLAPPHEPSLIRQGQALFNDARLCHQQWQSCASCHDSDARVDALNWDLLNDGQGNPKNAKSLLWSHRTPPTMALGVRATAEAAVRAGIKYILFTDQPDEVPTAIDAYLKSLEPEASPVLATVEQRAAAERGRVIFHEAAVGCARCHPGPAFTDLKRHRVGTLGMRDQADDRFDTPTLVELWRTAPYLHDGSAATLGEVLTTRNPNDEHGRTSHLTPAQINDLAVYVLSL